jgi:hypothetical protein
MTLEKVYHVFKVIPTTDKAILPYGLESLGLTPFAMAIALDFYGPKLWKVKNVRNRVGHFVPECQQDRGIKLGHFRSEFQLF